MKRQPKKSKLCFPKYLVVKYKMSGVDHGGIDGYCSGEEADGYDDNIGTAYEFVRIPLESNHIIDKNGFVSGLNLDKHKDGCIAQWYGNGSGYHGNRDNFHHTFKTVWVKIIEDDNKEEEFEKIAGMNYQMTKVIGFRRSSRMTVWGNTIINKAEKSASNMTHVS